MAIPIYSALTLSTSGRKGTKRMMGSLRIAVVAGALFSFSSTLFANLPPAMDRIPTDAYLVTTVRNLEQFQTNIETLATRMGLPPEALDQMGAARQLLRTPGLNPQGSASFAVMDLDDGAENFVAVLPVRDYQAFVTGLGGTGDAIDEVQIQDRMFFIKNLDGGFAAASPRRELITTFEGRPGQAQAHQEFLGQTGRNIADSSGMFIVANIPLLAPRIRETLDEGMQQVEMMAMMMGGGGMDLTKGREVLDAFLRDATAGVMGLRAGEQGAGMDFAAQFREGSELAGYFAAEGDARPLIGALPNQPFLFAMGLDARNPGLRQVLQFFAPAGDDPQPGVLQAVNPLQGLEHMDGMGVLWGTTPALVGGLFLNTVAYTRSAEPQKYMNWVREAMGAIHGQKMEGITYQTTMQDQRVGDREVQQWSLRMQVDPRHPGAQQASQMQMMVFGPAGLSGYLAPTQNGVVMTYSRNANLLDQAVTAANTPSGLGQEQGVRAVSEHLPAGRAFEGYIGVRNILETALGFMAMMGGGAMDVDLPDDLRPIGLAGTTSGGGLRMTVFIPTDVMTTMRQIAESMNGEDDWEEDEPATGLPRF